MTTLSAPELPIPMALPHSGLASPPWVGHAARFTGRVLRSSVAVISAEGDIDASNADALTEYTLGRVNGCRGLVLDLGDLNFFSADGFSALHRISVNCARFGTGWAIVPGSAASRVLRICDPQDSLPLADTVEAALRKLTASSPEPG
ncbi:anti-sigma factor antagonist [Mycolicibacterium sp. P9-64]|uniref:STAS domain-containing protein n=1 Tax=Mycolicibacterium sp. P9-64 TaxID=2024612 RepID=UPI0011ED45CA|nr:STAS domain-containing protein [Mycolicibacterium sp. P9-64]KAA0080565.1 anti-sigma factor antagonist [Mycolicibacterium sp. P9-64]